MLAFILSQLDGRAMAHALSRVSWVTIALAAFAFSFNLFLKAYRWQRLLLAQGIVLPASESLAAYLSGQFYAQVTLGRVGEFFRAEALLARGVSAGRALASCVFDRLLDVTIVFGLGAVFATLVLGDRTLALLALGVWFGLGIVAFALLRYAVPVVSGADANALQVWLGALESRRFIGRLVRGARELLAGMLPMLRVGPLLEALLWSGLSWFGYFQALFQLADGLHLPVSRVLLTATAAFAALSALLPVTVSGLGARELIYIQVLENHGVESESAVVLSLLHLLIMSASATLFGFVGVLWRQRQRARSMTP